MASVAIMIGGAIVNAIAFSGSSYMFSKLGHGDAHEEQIRHDKAVEQLQAAWAKKRTERLDWLNEELQREGHAVRSSQDVDQAMQEYALLNGPDAVRNIREAPEPVSPIFMCPPRPKRTVRSFSF
jgi:hypothetical protein